jgi:hypothetical protein
MKHVVAFATIGACLLVLSVGAALAGNLHTTDPNSISGTGKGQTGAVQNPNSHSCGGANSGPSAGALSAPGSPFAGGVSDTKYAGSGANANTSANPAAVSQYDVACFQAR